MSEDEVARMHAAYTKTVETVFSKKADGIIDELFKTETLQFLQSGVLYNCPEFCVTFWCMERMGRGAWGTCGGARFKTRFPPVTVLYIWYARECVTYTLRPANYSTD